MVGDSLPFFPLMFQVNFFCKGLDRKQCRFGVNRVVTWTNEQIESRGYTATVGKRPRLSVWTAVCQTLASLWVI